MRSLRVALALLTTLPLRSPQDWQPGDTGRAAPWFPLIGLLIGGLAWVTWTLLVWLFPPVIASTLSLLAWVALTGGLHLDGLADCCDGLLATAAPARRLEIMRDPRVGAYGVIGLVLILMLKAAALATLSPAAGAGILLAASLGRWCILPAAFLPTANPTGMAADFINGLDRRSLLSAGILPVGLAALLGTQGIAALVVGLLVTIIILAFAEAKIGGVTGDVLGCVVEVVESVVLLVFVARGA